MYGKFATENDLRLHVQGLITEDVTLSQKRVAREAGCNEGAFNQWLQGKDRYASHPATAEKVSRWLDSRERRAQVGATLPKAPEYVLTPSSEKIMAVLTFAQMAADFTVIYGGAGVGKTRTIARYQEMNPNVWVATMTPDCSTVASTLEEIAEAFGIRNDHAVASSRMRREICRRMKGTGGLLVIDEAQHLGNSGLEEIRSIHDATEIGVVLSGNESVYSRLTGGSRAAHFAQLFSRIGKKLRLNRPVDEDVLAIAERLNITGTAEQKLLIGIAQKPGALRGVVKTLRFADMLASGSGGPIAEEHIRAAWAGLGGEA